jgi:hypothetical protein
MESVYEGERKDLGDFRADGEIGKSELAHEQLSASMTPRG